jgi:hemoglobin/transferrin/lactoferrin receptor protein
LLDPSESAGALLKYGYFSNTRGWKASATGFGRANPNWSGLVSIVSSEHEEIEDGRGNRLLGSDTRQNVALAKIVGAFSHGQTVRFSFENLEELGNKLRRPEWAPGPTNPVFYMESNRRTARFGYEAKPANADWLDLDFNLSHTAADILQVAAFGPYTGEITGTQLDLRNTQRLRAHEVVYGLDHRRDEVSAGPDTNSSLHQEDGSVTGLFLQDDITVNDDLTLHAGARFDTYRLDDRLRQKFRHEGFSPNGGFTYAFTPRFSVNGSIATAFRGPEINDAFRIDLSQNDPNLDAEKARNYELRFLYREQRLQLEAGAYANRIEDIITNTLPWSRLYTNAGELKTDGFFARATYAARNAHFSLQYNHADTTLNGQTATRYQYSSLVSRIGDTWVADAHWRPLTQLDLGWNARLVQGLDDILVPFAITEVPDSRISKPGYLTHDFYLRWTPPFTDVLTINLTVKNAFDKYYRSHGSLEDLTAFPGFAGVIGAPEPGRDIRLSATLRF